MKHTTQATVTWAECGDRHTFVGTQWEVTVAAEVAEDARACRTRW
jgi:hypothetical protein